MDLDKDSTVHICDSEIRVCETSAIYIQGEGSIPTIERNTIKLCLSPAIKIGMGVLATIFDNSIRSNTQGIMIIDSKSKITKNRIEKSHENGILLVCTGGGNFCTADIEKNEIIGSKRNGILVKGDNAFPQILNNLIENNKKWGIKLSENAKAHIKNENKIMKNYNQGILIVEGCSAIVTNNVVSSNLKANIAYGGLGSQETKIEYNDINGSVAEGIFLVEGHKETMIRDNKVWENKDGIVLYNSEGTVRNNTITQNQRSGILTGGQTDADFCENTVTNNISIGIMIKDPSAPKLRDNTVKDNEYYQLSLEKKGKRLESYLVMNTIEGKNELPKNTCTIF